MTGFIIAVLVCAGANCEMAQPEPEVSYPTYEACKTAMTANAPALEVYVKQHPSGERQSSIVCLSQNAAIVEVEEPHDVLDTAIVHAEPSATSGYVDVVEKGERTLVTGRVLGTQWVRVLLKDGSTGFVYSDRLRKVGTTVAIAPPSVTPKPIAPTPVAPPSPAPSPAPSAAAPSAAPLARLGPGETRDCDHCPTMVSIAAGVLTMGSNDDPTEKPIHKVTIPAFALAKYVLTVAEWNACASDGGCGYKPPTISTDPARTQMTNLSFTDAIEYVAWLQKQTGKPYRLASEAEWEYAARAGTTTRYFWGDQVGTGHADCEGCGGAHNARLPERVDGFPANRFGLGGMAGGVAEWVEDCWHPTYQGAPADGSPWRSPNCAHHVLRGGSWKNGPKDITVSTRNFYDTSVRYLANGMRVALGGGQTGR